MKIVHICTSFNVGGTETMLVDILNEQCKTDAVYFIIINNSYNKHIYEKISSSVKKYKINRKRGSKNLIDLIKMNYLLLKINPDIIHCHGDAIINYIIKGKWKIFITVHELGYSNSSLFKYDGIISISKAVQKDLIERLNIDSIVVYNGINIEDVLVKTDYGFDKFKILCTGRLDHIKKGQDLLLEALNILINEKEITCIKVDFIGEGESLSYLTGLIDKYNLKDIVKFLGLMSRGHIYSNIKNYNLIVQPSRYEGFGLAVVEGMAAKVPVLVADSNGPMEIIDNGRYGFSFSSGNYENLGEKIIEVIDFYKRGDISEFVNNAFSHIEKNFSISKTVKTYLNEYKNKLINL